MSTSIRFYLRPGFTTTPSKNGTQDLFQGESVTHSMGRHFIWTYIQPGYTVPSAIEAAMESVSITHTVSHNGAGTQRRKYGTYSHKKATGEVSFIEQGNKTYSEFAVTAPNFEDAMELLELIRSGKIPPDTDWEAPQVVRPIDPIKEAIRNLLTSIGFWLDRRRFV